jgi:hypothetical protein
MPVKPNGGTESLAWYRGREYVLITVLGLLYLALMGKYGAFEVDNTWFLSFSYSFWVDHIPTDSFMLSAFPSGMGGVVAFGKLAAVVQGTVLNLFGWSLTNAILLSIVFTLLSLVLLAQTCRQLGYSTNFTLCYVALLGFSEPFVSVSQLARYEFLLVFLLALALWLATRNRPVLAVLTAALATEIEPTGIVVALATVTFLFSLNVRSKATRPSRLLLSILVGVAGALAVYLVLHRDIVSILRTADWISFNRRPVAWPGGFVTAYYIVFRRHLPELAVVIAAVVMCFLPGKRHLLWEWPALCVGVIVVASSLLRWPNVHYFCLIAPFLCLFVLQVFYADRYRNLILAAIVLFTVPQYAWRYRIWSSHHAAVSKGEQREVSEAIARAALVSGKPPEELRIVGNYWLWFAHPYLFVNLDRLIFTPATLDNADLVLCFDQHVNPVSRMDISCPELNAADYREVESLTLRSGQVRLLRPAR